MIKSVQISDLSAEDFYYITALTKPQIEKLLKDNVFQMQLFDKDICEVIDNNIRYILRCNPIRVKEIRENRQSKLASAKKLSPRQPSEFPTNKQKRKKMAGSEYIPATQF